MTKANNALTYCAGCGRLIPGSELQAGLSEAREAGIVCISCVERSDPRRAAEIREMSFREAERAKVSVQLMWAPPGVIPPRAARLAHEGGAGHIAPGAVDPISGEIGRDPLPDAPMPPGGGVLLQGTSQRRIPWWIVGVASLLMSVLGAVTQRLIMSATEPAGPVPPRPPVPVAARNPPLPGPGADPALPPPPSIEITPPPEPAERPVALPPVAPPPVLTTPPPTPSGPAPRPAPSAEDEARAQALLTSADTDFNDAPDRAEKLYATILDFYPTTAAATMARLRQTDLAAARDRADCALLQSVFDRAMAEATYETYWQAVAGHARIVALVPHGPQSRQLQQKHAALLQEKCNLLKGDLAARGPLIIGACIDNNELARATAIVNTVERFGDPTSQALAAALRRKIEGAVGAENFRNQAPAIRAKLACAPYVRGFEARLVKWDFPGAARDLLPPGSEPAWQAAGPGYGLQLQILAVYFQTRFREALVKKAQAAAQAKTEFQLDWTPLRADAGPGPATGAGWAALRAREIHTGTLARVSVEGFTLVEQGRELRVDWPRLSAASLRLLAQYAPVEPAASTAAGAAEAAAGVELASALQALALARGEIPSAACEAARDPWRTWFELRRIIDSDTLGEQNAQALRRAIDAGDTFQLLSAQRAQEEFAQAYPLPLAFLAPEGRAVLEETRAFLAKNNAGTLLYFQNYQPPDRLYDGIKFEALAARADQRPGSGQFLAGARGGTQRVLIRFEKVKVPAGQRIKKAFLRLPVLAAATSRTDIKHPPLDGLLGLIPLPCEFNPGHVTWDFCDTMHSTRWPVPGAFSSDGPEPFPGRLVPGTTDELLFEITPYFDALAKTDYTDPGPGLVLKVLKNEPDYTITLPDPATAVLATSPAPRLELQVVPKEYAP